MAAVRLYLDEDSKVYPVIPDEKADKEGYILFPDTRHLIPETQHPTLDP